MAPPLAFHKFFTVCIKMLVSPLAQLLSQAFDTVIYIHVSCTVVSCTVMSECFFKMYLFSAVKGKTPQVGDRVLVEAVYNPNMPFKWNAQRIQTLPQLANQSVRTLKNIYTLAQE